MSQTAPGAAPERVDVCLTSIRSRLEQSAMAINSLLAQDYPNFAVTLYLSREAHLLDEGVETLPEALRHLQSAHRDRFQIVFTPNTGSYRKIIPMLAQRIGAGGLIATADDDTLYPADWLSTLVSAYRDYGCCIAFRGRRMTFDAAGLLGYRKWDRMFSAAAPDMLALATGKDGVLYHSRFFTPSVLDMAKALRLAPTSDDLWLKWHCAMAEVPVRLLRGGVMGSFPEIDMPGGRGRSLSRAYNGKGGNDQAIAALEDEFEREHQFSFRARYAPKAGALVSDQPRGGAPD